MVACKYSGCLYGDWKYQGWNHHRQQGTSRATFYDLPSEVMHVTSTIFSLWQANISPLVFDSREIRLYVLMWEEIRGCTGHFWGIQLATESLGSSSRLFCDGYQIPRFTSTAVLCFLHDQVQITFRTRQQWGQLTLYSDIASFPLHYHSASLPEAQPLSCRASAG